MLFFYALPSISALVLKLIVFWFGWHSLKRSSPWLLIFFAGIFGVNSMELLSFYYVSHPEDGWLVLTAYYVFVELTFFSLLALSLDSVNKLSTPIKYFLFLCLVIFLIPLLIPGAALVGVKSIGYSVTRVAGPYYVIVQLGILFPLLSCIAVLLFFSFFGDKYVKGKAVTLLLSCSPIFFSAIVVMSFMQAGYSVNGAGVVSLGITMAMFLLLLNERKQPLFHFIDRRYIFQLTRFLPQSDDHRFTKKMMALVADPSIGLAKGRELIEQEMIREALVVAQGSKTKAADLLGVSRQTLVRRLQV